MRSFHDTTMLSYIRPSRRRDLGCEFRKKVFRYCSRGIFAKKSRFPFFYTRYRALVRLLIRGNEKNIFLQYRGGADGPSLSDTPFFFMTLVISPLLPCERDKSAVISRELSTISSNSPLSLPLAADRRKRNVTDIASARSGHEFSRLRYNPCPPFSFFFLPPFSFLFATRVIPTPWRRSSGNRDWRINRNLGNRSGVQGKVRPGNQLE